MPCLLTLSVPHYCFVSPDCCCCRTIAQFIFFFAPIMLNWKKKIHSLFLHLCHTHTHKHKKFLPTRWGGWVGGCGFCLLFLVHVSWLGACLVSILSPFTFGGDDIVFFSSAGEIPDTLGNLINLESLDLSNNADIFGEKSRYIEHRLQYSRIYTYRYRYIHVQPCVDKESCSLLVVLLLLVVAAVGHG